MACSLRRRAAVADELDKGVYDIVNTRKMRMGSPTRHCLVLWLLQTIDDPVHAPTLRTRVPHGYVAARRALRDRMSLAACGARSRRGAVVVPVVSAAAALARHERRDVLAVGTVFDMVVAPACQTFQVRVAVHRPMVAPALRARMGRRNAAAVGAFPEVVIAAAGTARLIDAGTVDSPMVPSTQAARRRFDGVSYGTVTDMMSTTTGKTC